MTQDFWNRKMTYAINVQVVCGDEGHILDIVADWQGANIDARIWNTSRVKQVISRQRQFLIAGDSGYPISATCITLYLVRDAAADPSKCLFNKRHARLQTVCSVTLFGRMKRRLHCLKMLRCKYAWARETVYACAVLHNMAILWADRDLDNDAVAAMLLPPAPGPPAVYHEDEEPLLVHARGQNVRDALRLNMPPA